MCHNVSFKFGFLENVVKNNVFMLLLQLKIAICDFLFMNKLKQLKL